MAKSPRLEEWRELYKIAGEFKSMECWNWMFDSDLFGVQNPRDGEIGYCCVMGQLGEHFALGVYPGAEGLQTYLHLSTVEPEMAEPEDLFIQKCLQVSFEDRRQLMKEDREVIQKLGLKYRGSQNWPLFRNYSPGCVPWFLDSEEVEFLALAIEQAMDVCGRAKNDADLLDPGEEDVCLVRIPEKKGAGLVWHDEWRKLPPPEPPKFKLPVIDQFRLQRIRQSARIIDAVWEFDYFYLPNPVRDGKDRPYFPVILMWGDRESLFILSNELTKPAEYQDYIVPQFLSLIEKTGALPEQVWVRKEDALEMLKSVTSVLGTKIKLKEQLRAIREIKDSMMNFFF